VQNDVNHGMQQAKLCLPTMQILAIHTHSLGVLGVSVLRNPSLDCLLDAPLKQGDFRESSMIFVQPSHSDCLEFGTIILAQGVQGTHDYVLIFSGEFLPGSDKLLG
jgi:hypothetical protein